MRIARQSDLAWKSENETTNANKKDSSGGCASIPDMPPKKAGGAAAKPKAPAKPKYDVFPIREWTAREFCIQKEEKGGVWGNTLPTILILGKSFSGKTCSAIDICFELQDVFQCAVVFSGSEDGTPTFANMFPDIFIYSEVTAERLKAIIRRQLAMKKKYYGDKNFNPQLLVMFDDIIDAVISAMKEFQVLFKRGRHFYIMVIVVAQSVFHNAQRFCLLAHAFLLYGCVLYACARSSSSSADDPSTSSSDAFRCRFDDGAPSGSGLARRLAAWLRLAERNAPTAFHRRSSQPLLKKHGFPPLRATECSPFLGQRRVGVLFTGRLPTLGRPPVRRRTRALPPFAKKLSVPMPATPSATRLLAASQPRSLVAFLLCSKTRGDMVPIVCWHGSPDLPDCFL
jgi:hypothetical protein